MTSSREGRGLGATKAVGAGAELTSDNKQVAPTPRYARLRGTPAQESWDLEAMLEESTYYGFVGPCEGAGVATLERYLTLT